MGEIEREEKREAKIMEKAKSNDTSPTPQKNNLLKIKHVFQALCY